MIVLGLVTLFVFFLRVAVFRFYESPKFLLSKGRDAEAIEVLHKIAKFNKAPPPTLTVEMLAAIDEAASDSSVLGGPRTTGEHAKHVVANAINGFRHLKALFTNKLQVFIFALLTVTYMVSLMVLRPSVGLH